MEDNKRNLTERDVEAIVGELKRQLLADFQIEVGRGVLSWAKRAFWLLLLVLAVYGISSDKDFINAAVEVRK